MPNAKGIFLEVDPSIVENNLKIYKDSKDDEWTQLQTHFPLVGSPSKEVLPHPGFCVKTKIIGIETKFFVNVCHTDAIPKPKDITETELEEIIESDDAESFRVPISIGEVQEDVDKNGNSVKKCDIAIHPDFFCKIEKISLFKSFFLTLVFEAIQNKHQLYCVDDRIILKNRKCYGTLQTHRIRQTDVDKEMRANNMSKKLIEEIESITSNKNETREPEYKLYKQKNSDKNCLFGEFKLPDIKCADDIDVDIGEDRIILEAKSRHYFLDIFVPYFIKQGNCSGTFDQEKKLLTIRMPLKGG